MPPPKSGLGKISESAYEQYRPDGMPEPVSKTPQEQRVVPDLDSTASAEDGSHYSQYRPNSEAAKGISGSGSDEMTELAGEIVPGYNDNNPNSYRPGKEIPNSSKEDGARAARASSVAANDGSRAGSDDEKEELKMRPPIVYRPKR